MISKIDLNTTSYQCRRKLLRPAMVIHRFINKYFGNKTDVLISYFFNCIRYYLPVKTFAFDDDLTIPVKAAFNDWREILKPIQIEQEFLLLLKLVKKYQPKTILEIGSANGGALFLIARSSRKDAHLISLDLPSEPYRSVYAFIRRYFFTALKYPGQRLDILYNDSQRISTKKKIEKILNGKKIDMLFIDGDHSYHGVKRDFQLYSPLVHDDGVVVFHDIIRHPPGSVDYTVEVDVFWKEVKRKFNHIEIIEDRDQFWAGIGISSKNTFFGSNAEEIKSFLGLPISPPDHRIRQLEPVVRYFGMGDINDKAFFDKRISELPEYQHIKNVPLFNNQPLKIVFKCPINGLCRLDYFIGTYQRVNPGRIELQIYNNLTDKLPIREVSIEASSLKDNVFAVFQFEPVNESQNRSYHVVLTLKDGQNGRFPGLWYGKRIGALKPVD